MKDHLIPMIKESRHKVAEMSRHSLTPDEMNELYCALIVDGERANLLTLTDCIGIDQKYWTTEEALTNMVKDHLKMQQLATNSLNNSSSTSTTSSVDSVPTVNRFVGAIQNIGLGKFGARRSGKDQFLDLSPLFKNVKKRLHYWVGKQYHHTIDNKQSTEFDLNGSLINYYTDTLRKETKKLPKKKHSDLKFDPRVAKKHAVILTVVSEVCRSFATAEVIKKGYDNAYLMPILEGKYTKVMEDYSVGWYTYPDNTREYIVNEVIPECIRLMKTHHGLIPEADFDR